MRAQVVALDGSEPESGSVRPKQAICSPLASGGRITGRATWTHQSEVYPTTDLSEAIKQDGYSLLSAGVIWQTAGPWSFALEGKNLTDKEYRTSGYNIAALGVLTGFYGAPRTFSLSARYDF